MPLTCPACPAISVSLSRTTSGACDFMLAKKIQAYENSSCDYMSKPIAELTCMKIVSSSKRNPVLNRLTIYHNLWLRMDVKHEKTKHVQAWPRLM